MHHVSLKKFDFTADFLLLLNPVMADIAMSIFAVCLAKLLTSSVLGLLVNPHFACGSDCSVEPISLPWSNITLDDVALNRGIAAQFGDQTLGLRVTTMLNNTRVRNIRDCQFGNTSDQSGCTGSSGSAFDPTVSSTWTTAPIGDWNVSVVDMHDPDEIVYDGWDTIKFFGLDPIPGFPLASIDVRSCFKK
jgi:hypothetical protein